MSWDIETIITMTSTVVAIISAGLAWQAAKVAGKSYNAELIGMLYSTYQSDEMVRDLRIAWGLYHKLWRKHSNPRSSGDEKADKGMLIPDDLAIAFLMELDRDSKEVNAIHNLINFWTYIELLMKKKALTPEEIVAFTSPRILGFLYPMTKAHAAKYGRQRTKKSDILGYAYKILCLGNGYFI